MPTFGRRNFQRPRGKIPEVTPSRDSQARPSQYVASETTATVPTIRHRAKIEECLGNADGAKSFARQALRANPYFSLLHARAAEELAA